MIGLLVADDDDHVAGEAFLEPGHARLDPVVEAGGYETEGDGSDVRPEQLPLLRRLVLDVHALLWSI